MRHYYDDKTGIMPYTATLALLSAIHNVSGNYSISSTVGGESTGKYDENSGNSTTSASDGK